MRVAQPSQGATMPDIEYIRAEIERMRIQVHRQRGEIRQLQRAGISTTSADALLDRMLNNIDGLCAERDRLKKEALAEVRRLAPREGWRYHHVQAIIVAIDQYAEAALGNREFFLNKPYGVGGGSKDNIP